MAKTAGIGRRGFLKSSATGLGALVHLSAGLTRPPDATEKFEGTRVVRNSSRASPTG